MMQRLKSCLAKDALNLYRSGYLVELSLLTLAGISLAGYATAMTLWRLAPLLALLDIYVLAYAATLHLIGEEKSSGALAYLDRTPLKPHEYLLAKIIVIGLPVIPQALILIRIWIGVGTAYMPVLLGIGALIPFFVLMGFITTLLQSGKSRYLLRVVVSSCLLVPPALPYLGWNAPATLFLHPVQACLVLIHGVFAPVSPLSQIGAISYVLVWCLGLVFIGRMAIRRFHAQSDQG